MYNILRMKREQENKLIEWDPLVGARLGLPVLSLIQANPLRPGLDFFKIILT